MLVKKLSRSLALISLFSSISLLLSSCLAKEDSRRTVLIWGHSLGPDDKGREAVIAEFERRHPDIHIRMFNLGAGEMNPQKLMTSIVGEVPPDIIDQDRFSIADWASRGAFQPLDELIARDSKEATSPRAEDYYPAAWKECSYGGKVYAIPRNVDDRILYWNKKIFREKSRELIAAGLDPNRAPRTWSELLRYSKVLTEISPDGTLKRAGFIPNFGNSWLYLYAFQNDAEFLDPTGTRCQLGSPQAVEALDFMKQGYDLLGGWQRAEEFQTVLSAGVGKPILRGTIAMVIDGDWGLSDLLKFGPDAEIGSAPPPVPDWRVKKYPQNPYVTWSGGFSWAIPTGAKNREDAWTFIKFVCSPEARLMEYRVQRLWDKRRGREYIPRMSALKSMNEQLFEEFKPNRPQYAAAWKQHMDLLPFGKFRPVTFVGQLLWDEHARSVQVACSGAMNSQQALLEGQQKVQRELDRAAERNLYPEVSKAWPTVAWAGAMALILGAWAWSFRNKPMKGNARYRARWGAFFITPWLAGFAVFTLWPMLASLFFAFTDTNAMNEPRWVGLRNFVELGGPEKAHLTLAFTNLATLAIFGVPLGVLSGLGLALLLERPRSGIRAYRTAFYVPSIVPGIAGAVLWLWLLTPDKELGIINAIWAQTIRPWLGFSEPGWLKSAEWAKPAYIFMGLWGAGGGLVMWLAALKGVPKELYEASTLDGATGYQQFKAVTLPALSPIVFFSTVIGFIGAIQEFDRAYVFSKAGAGPLDSLLLPVPELFNQAFSYFRMGYASALAWLIFVLVLIMTGIQFLLSRFWVKGGRGE